MKPLRGTALIVLDPGLVFLLVDNLFGGDGRFHTRVEGRDFTQTEQRIIHRILEICLKPIPNHGNRFIRSSLNISVQK
jgi:flagellar motor switch protein FliM